MAKRVIDLRGQTPLLDIASLGRSARTLIPAQRLQIRLTVRGVPEVMVKVSGGARSLSGVQAHMAYIGRHGDLALEMDTGERALGKGVEREIVEDWGLSVDANRRFTERSIQSRKPSKLVHNLIFSMPPGTPSEKVLRAVRKLAHNEWQLKHRYVVTLHTDSHHPHVHVVLMAIGEDGERLNIRKATLRSWRGQFAQNLRELGVAANATERAVRGLGRTQKLDGIYRSAQRGESTFLNRQANQVANHAINGISRRADGGETLRKTRAAVLEGWRSVAATLRAVGDHDIADQIRVFVGGLPAPKTEKELLWEYQKRGPTSPDIGGRGRQDAMIIFGESSAYEIG